MPKVRTASVSSEASVKLHNVKAPPSPCTLLTVGGQKQQEVVAYCTSRHRSGSGCCNSSRNAAFLLTVIAVAFIKVGVMSLER